MAKYVQVKLTANLNGLIVKEKQILPSLIDVTKIMNDLFWYEAYGNRNSLLTAVKDGATRKFVQINYGPWDLLKNNEPFILGVKAKAVAMPVVKPLP